MNSGITAPRVGVFHPSTQHSWQTALAFQQSNRLAWYATSVFYDPARWPYKIENYLPTSLSKRVHRQFRRRYHPLLDPAKVRHVGHWQWVQSAAHRLDAHRVVQFASTQGTPLSAKALLGELSARPVGALVGVAAYVFLEVFRWAKGRGIYCVLDQTTRHPAWLDRVLRAEWATNPEFFLKSFQPIPAAAIERERGESRWLWGDRRFGILEAPTPACRKRLPLSTG